MTTKQIRAEDQSTASMEDFIPLFGFANDHVFLTKSGDLGVVLEMEGVEYECLDPEDVDARARRFEISLRAFDADYRLYQCVCKTWGVSVPHQSEYVSPTVELAVRERIGQLNRGQSISAHLVVLFSRFRRPESLSARVKAAVLSRWSERVLGDDIKWKIYSAAVALVSAVQTLADQMSDHSPMRLLRRTEAVLVYRRLFNPDEEIARTMGAIPAGSPLSRRIASTDVEIHRNNLQVGNYLTRVLTLKELPLETRANLLRPIVESESQCVLVTEWSKEPHDRMVKAIRSKKNHALVYSNMEMAQGVAMAFVGKAPAKDPEPTQSQTDAARLLDSALSAMENDGLSFGRMSLSLVVRDTDPARLALSVTRLYKSFAELGIEVYAETLGLWRQYCAILPGNDRFNGRYHYISATNYADFALLFLPQRGQPRNETLNGEYLMAAGTRQHTPYMFNLHWGDSPHAFFCGVNGSGKTFTVNSLVTHAQKYNPWTLILDIGGSYRNVTEQFGGSYLEMDPSRMGVTINPFCLPKTPKNLTFLYSFVQLLIESGEYRMTDDDKRDLYLRIVAMYKTTTEGKRTLGTLYWMLRTGPKGLRQHLARWVREDEYGRAGQYGPIFDNATDTLTLARFQCCDFTGLDDMPEIAEPLLFYVLHRSRANVYDVEQADVYKLTVADECWRFLDTDITRKYFIAAMKTWRKHNASIWSITQQPEDMDAAHVGRILKEAQTSVLFANPRMDEEVYKAAFKLNATEIREVKALQPKREFLIKQPFLSRILVLDASETEAGMYSSTPQQEQKRRRIA